MEYGSAHLSVAFLFSSKWGAKMDRKAWKGCLKRKI
jgi:hypothetical protein